MSFTQNLSQRDLKGLYQTGVIAFFILSLAVGSQEIGESYESYDITIHIISTPLWILLGIIFCYCLYKAFFDVWHYGLFLLVSYICVGAGVTIFTEFNDFSGFWGAVKLGSGIALEAFGIGLVLELVYLIWKVRRELMRIDGEKGIETYSQYSLGHWYLAPALFVILVNIAFFDWSRWMNDKGELYIYFASEIGILLTSVYILFVPQKQLFEKIEFTDEEYDTKPIGVEYEVEEAPKETPLFSKSSKSKEGDLCPGCERELVFESRTCPLCGREHRFGWCPSYEGYIITCPHCKNSTFYGKSQCTHCQEEIKKEFVCPSCGKERSIREWSLVEN